MQEYIDNRFDYLLDLVETRGHCLKNQLDVLETSLMNRVSCLDDCGKISFSNLEFNHTNFGYCGSFTKIVSCSFNLSEIKSICVQFPRLLPFQHLLPDEVSFLKLPWYSHHVTFRNGCLYSFTFAVKNYILTIQDKTSPETHIFNYAHGNIVVDDDILINYDSMNVEIFKLNGKFRPRNVKQQIRFDNIVDGYIRNVFISNVWIVVRTSLKYSFYNKKSIKLDYEFEDPFILKQHYRVSFNGTVFIIDFKLDADSNVSFFIMDLEGRRVLKRVFKLDCAELAEYNDRSWSEVGSDWSFPTITSVGDTVYYYRKLNPPNCRYNFVKFDFL